MNGRASCVLLFCAGLAAAAAAADSGDMELSKKAEALVNLPRYVEWPNGAFVVPRTPLMIGVYGHSKIHKRIFDAAHGKVLNGRLVMVRRFHWPQVPNAHVLFIAPSERYRLPWIMKKIEHTTVLTVSDFDDFLPRGGILRMSMKEEKLCFHVNTIAASEIGLKLSSQFLNVADQVVGAQ